VTLYCSGARENNAHPEVELVSVSPHSPIFSKPVCPISEPVGIPIQIMRFHTQADIDSRNVNAYNLKLRLKNNCEGSSIFNCAGYATDGPLQDIEGNVIAVRMDKQPLDVEIMQVLCEFCELRIFRVVQAIAQTMLGKPADEIETVLKRKLSRKAFRIYLEEHCLRERRKELHFRSFMWSTTSEK
jgi:hypothetical protein